ncbi:MAG TPA: hypothetical protein VIT88_00270, partial [Pyrinomonadaceae bacterium]
MRSSNLEPPTRSSHLHLRSCLSLLLVWALLCALATPRVEAAVVNARNNHSGIGEWLNNLAGVLTSYVVEPSIAPADTPTDAVISRTRPTLGSGRIEGNLRV